MSFLKLSNAGFCLIAGLSVFGVVLVNGQIPGFSGGSMPFRSYASGGGSIVLGYAVQNESPFAAGSFSGSSPFRVRVNGVLEPFLIESTSGISYAEHGRLWAMLGIHALRTRNEGLTNSVSGSASAGMTERFTFVGPEGFTGKIEVTFYPQILQFFNVGTFFDASSILLDLDEAGEEAFGGFGETFIYDQNQVTGTATASVQYRVFRRLANVSLSETDWVFTSLACFPWSYSLSQKQWLFP